MNIVSSSTVALNLHVFLEPTETGQIMASIAELANCQVEANTRAEALVAIQELVSDRLSKVEVLPLEIPLKDPERENPWTEFVGMFQGDAEFAEMAAQWQAEPAEQNTDDLT
ncbi:MAG: type II toxin-antitoxin system HicB family antitoxin [Symploca sp. SIO2C1]|nr:type II toxin-antitoxin system HicB family antitoxin [Symploca sp. SIO2C1]